MFLIDDSSLLSWPNSFDCWRIVDASGFICVFDMCEGGPTNEAWHEAAYITDATIVVLYALDVHNDHDRDRLPFLVDVMLVTFISIWFEIQR